MSRLGREDLECHTKISGPDAVVRECCCGFKVGAGMTKSVIEEITLVAGRGARRAQCL